MYRVEYIVTDKVELVIQTFKITKETEKTLFLSNGKQIRKYANKKYANETLEGAYKDFYKRKLKQLDILKNSINELEQAVELCYEKINNKKENS